MPRAAIGGGAAAPSGARDTLTLAVIETEAGLQELAAEWDALLAAVDRPSPFLCWQWVLDWWRQFHGDSRLLIASARGVDGRLLGLAPLHIVRRHTAGVPVRSLEFLGYRGAGVCADHLDFITRPEARLHTLAGLVRALLARRAEWDVFVFADLAEDSLLPRVWEQAAANLDLARGEGEVCHYLALPAASEIFWTELQRVHPQLVRNVRRYRRRLQRRYQVRFVPESAASERPALMAALARLHGLSRARQSQASNFDRGPYRRFHESVVGGLAARGQLYLARLECDGQVVAVMYGLFQNRVLYYYQSGFDTSLAADGVGKLLLAEVLEDAMDRLGAREFDFLRGAEAYKARWTSAARHTFHLYGWQRHPAARLNRLQWRGHRHLARLRAWAATHLVPAPPGSGPHASERP